MGRVTIFSTEGCPACRRAKAALSSRSIPFVDVDVEAHPSRRADMISLSDRTSVPQVFVGENHVGGCDETLVMLAEWDASIHEEEEEGKGGEGDEGDEGRTRTRRTTPPEDGYVRLIGSTPDPVDPRLAPPTGIPVARKSFEIDKARCRDVMTIRGKTYTSLELTRMLIRSMPRDDESHTRRCMTWHRDAFVGSSGISALRRIFELDTRDEAIDIGEMLRRGKYLHRIDVLGGKEEKDDDDDDDDEDDDGRHFGDDDRDIFVLQPFRRPRVLNSLRAWGGGRRRRQTGAAVVVAAAADDDDDDDIGPMNVVRRLHYLWSTLESRHANDDDGDYGVVDYGPAMRDDELYWRFEEDVCELQCKSASLINMNERTRMAYVINVYNVMIKYAFCKVGIPSTSSDRASFYGDVSVDLGGEILSFDDLEHGILRGNARHPYQLYRRFTTPARQRLALTRVDPRIHFALNCGGGSCPPVKKYTPEAIDEELRLAASAFCEMEDNVRIDEGNRRVHLSKLLYWYRSDFAKSNVELPKTIAEYLSKEKRCKMDRMILNGNFSVKFIDYDWSTHDKVNAMKYKKGDLYSYTTLGWCSA